MVKKKQPKKDKPLYDSNGRWVEERGRIKGAIRRTFRLSPQMREVLEAARVELSPALKKDGTPGKKNRVRYRCAACGELFSQKNVQVDHMETVVPLHQPEADMSYDDIVRGVFCNKDNLQVLCSTSLKKNNGIASCHKKKTDKEIYIRKRLKEVIEVGTINPNYRGQIKRVLIQISGEYEEYLSKKEKKAAEKAKRKRLRLLKLQLKH